MILVLGDAFDLLGLEQEVIGHEFKHGARQGPDIGVMHVVMPQDDLGGSVLPGLDALGEVLVGETGVAHVYDLEEYLVVQVDLHVLPLHYQRVPGLGAGLLLGYWLLRLY